MSRPRKVALDHVPGTDANRHPVVGSGIVDTNDLADPQSTSAIADKDHLVTSAILRPETEDVVLASADLDKQYAADLKFNEEIVEITIAEDNSEFPVDPVYMGCNGKEVYVRRGVPTKIKRKFVESLCSPLIRVNTKQTKNNLGEDATEIEQRRSLQYPFQISDPNPRGKEWLRRLMTRG